MPTFADDYEAIRALKTRWDTLFGVTLAATYETYGGVDVKLKTDEDDEPENVGKPLILLEQESGERSEWSSARSEYRRVVASVSTIVSDSAGAVVGTANTVASDELISKAIVNDVEENRASYWALGLEGIRIVPQRLAKDKNTVTRRINHRVTFEYNRD